MQDEIEIIHAPKIAENPYSQGSRLKGNFSGFWKYVFRCNGIAYRVAYEIKSTELIIAVIMIGTRENFYKELKRRVRYKKSRFIQ